jgi:hypothetical protein
VRNVPGAPGLRGLRTTTEEDTLGSGTAFVMDNSWATVTEIVTSAHDLIGALQGRRWLLEVRGASSNGSCQAS